MYFFCSLKCRGGCIHFLFFFGVMVVCVLRLNRRKNCLSHDLVCYLSWFLEFHLSGFHLVG